MANYTWNKNIGKKIVQQAQKGMMYATDAIFNRSQTYTPFDDGELTLGARITSEGEGTDFFSTCISYGNNAVSSQYALIQHENLAYNHRAPEQAKFLERAFDEESSHVPARIENSIKA
jgi:hypothetical protein